MMRIIGLIIKAVIVGYLIIFSVANTGMITLNLLFDSYTLTLPTFLFTLIALFIGAIFAVVSSLGSGYRYRKEIKKLNREISNANINYAKIQNLTLTSGTESENTSKTKSSDIENSSIRKQLR